MGIKGHLQGIEHSITNTTLRTLHCEHCTAYPTKTQHCTTSASAIYSGSTSCLHSRLRMFSPTL
jgi:hypothetical protein